MQARLDLAVSKGCDGVEPDNVDSYANTNGLGLTAADQLDFNRFVAAEAHARGLSVGLKNDLAQVKSLQPAYDWALNEQCSQYGECSSLTPFVTAGKAVFGVEYTGSASYVFSSVHHLLFILPSFSPILTLVFSKFCPSMVTSKFSWMLKDLDLGAKATQCCTYASGGCAVKPAYPSHPFPLLISSSSMLPLILFLATHVSTTMLSDQRSKKRPPSLPRLSLSLSPSSLRLPSSTLPPLPPPSPSWQSF